MPISDGGAIAVVDMAMNATYTIENSTFEENQSGDDGGAILFQGKAANAGKQLQSRRIYLYLSCQPLTPATPKRGQL